MSYPVKCYKSTDTGAPQLQNTAGQLLSVLDVICDGYNSKTVTITSSAGVATVADTAHGRNTGDIILVAGANQSDYNGEFAITVTGPDAYTYPVSNSPASPATGTITAKMAPMVGWSKAFTGTNKRAYKSSGAGATGFYLRVDDTTAQYATVAGYETMSGIDTGTGVFIPQATSVWYKSNAASNRAWQIVCDDRMIYLWVAWDGTQANAAFTWFGDIPSFKAGDLYNCVLASCSNTTPAVGSHPYSFNYGISAFSGGKCIARAYNQLGTVVQALSLAGLGILGTDQQWGGGSVNYPNRPDNGLHLRYPIDVYDGSTFADLRGILPGMYVCPQSNPLAHQDKIINVVGLEGKTFLVGKSCHGSYTATQFVDITGPWR
jgi:hypothetical protein